MARDGSLLVSDDASNRIYLGRFNATPTGTEPSFRIGGITGLGGAIPELRAFHGIPDPPPPPPPPTNPAPAPPAEPPRVDDPEPQSYPPVEDPSIVADDPIILIGIPCEGEGCADLDEVDLFHPDRHLVTTRALPEPRIGLLVLLGTSLIALQRARR